MKCATIDDRFLSFVAKPTLRKWHAARRMILADSAFDPYGESLRFAESQLAAGDFQACRKTCRKLGSVRCLSPRWHFLQGVAALELQREEEAAERKLLTQLCLSQLLETGDGTASAPFQVTYLSDEYDVLKCLGVNSLGQELTESDGRFADVIAADDGRDYWFDVHDLLSVTRPVVSRAMGRAPKRRRPSVRPV